MKRLLIFLILINYNCFSQDYKLQEKSISVVFKVDSISKIDIHSRALAAIANLYNSANNVIQLNDIQNNKIVVKGRSSIFVKNDMKALLPKNPYVQSLIEITYDHTINIDSKDGRYRMIYQVTSSPKNTDLKSANSFGYGISFIKKDENEIQQMIKAKIEPLENMKILYGKKKREAYKKEIPIAYEFFYNKCLTQAKSTLNSINDFVQQNNKITNYEW